MTFGEFVRTTVDNFRRFFAAPFAGGDGTGGGPQGTGPGNPVDPTGGKPDRMAGATAGPRNEPAPGNAEAGRNLPPFLQTRAHAQQAASATTGSREEPGDAASAVEGASERAEQPDPDPVPNRPADDRPADEHPGDENPDESLVDVHDDLHDEPASTPPENNDTTNQAQSTAGAHQRASEDTLDGSRAEELSPAATDPAADVEATVAESAAPAAKPETDLAAENRASIPARDTSEEPTVTARVEAHSAASASPASSEESSEEPASATTADSIHAPGPGQETAEPEDNPEESAPAGEHHPATATTDDVREEVAPAEREAQEDESAEEIGDQEAGDQETEDDEIGNETVVGAGGEIVEEASDSTPGEEQAAIVQGALDLPDETIPPEIHINVRETSLPLTAVLESLLFVADEPVEIGQLAKALDLSPKVVTTGLERLEILYRRNDRGLRLLTLDGRHQLVTLPAAAGAIEDFLNLDLTTRLSGPALETLAVIAYRQPVTRAQVESVRGVDCSGVLRSLLQRGLVEEAGRLETVGRPILYGVTDLFMQHFGLTGLDELPELNLEDADTLWAATELLDDADGLDAETAAQLATMRDQAADALVEADPADDSDTDNPDADDPDTDDPTDILDGQVDDGGADDLDDDMSDIADSDIADSDTADSDTAGYVGADDETGAESGGGEQTSELHEAADDQESGS